MIFFVDSTHRPTYSVGQYWWAIEVTLHLVFNRGRFSSKRFHSYNSVTSRVCCNNTNLENRIVNLSMMSQSDRNVEPMQDYCSNGNLWPFIMNPVLPTVV